MAKCYTLEKAKATGWWYWACKDGSDQGWALSKKEAKTAAASACGSDCIIIPPWIDYCGLNGYLSYFSANDLEGKSKTFSVGEIDENLFLFISGFNDFESSLCSATEKVISILKIWGIYNGGVEEDDVIEKHYLNQEKFDKLADKDWYGLSITLENDGTITWDFPA